MHKDETSDASKGTCCANSSATVEGAEQQAGCKSCTSFRCSPCIVIWGLFFVYLAISALMGK